MGENTHIEWCDHTFNPWEGCTKVSPGCANCYAEARNARFGGGAAKNWGAGAPRRRTSLANWKQPIAWNREEKSPVDAPGVHRRTRVFCASLADWLDDEVPLEWLIDLLDLIRVTPNLDWLLLTKRPQNWRARLELVFSHCSARGGALAAWVFAWLASIGRRGPGNVWIGTTVEDQRRADERIPELLKIPSAVRFLSCEPLLEHVDLGCPCWLSLNSGPGGECENCGKVRNLGTGISWVICGGESGPHARPMYPAWARSLRDQCAGAGVPFFFKQWGEHAVVLSDDDIDEPMREGEPPQFIRVGKKAAGRVLDGVEHSAFPTAEKSDAH